MEKYKPYRPDGDTMRIYTATIFILSNVTWSCLVFPHQVDFSIQVFYPSDSVAMSSTR